MPAEEDDLSEEANKVLVRRHYEDIVKLNNPAAAREQMSEGVIDHAAPPGLASRGPKPRATRWQPCAR